MAYECSWKATPTTTYTYVCSVHHLTTIMQPYSHLITFAKIVFAYINQLLGTWLTKACQLSIYLGWCEMNYGHNITLGITGN